MDKSTPTILVGGGQRGGLLGRTSVTFIGGFQQGWLILDLGEERESESKSCGKRGACLPMSVGPARYPRRHFQGRPPYRNQKGKSFPRLVRGMFFLRLVVPPCSGLLRLLKYLKGERVFQFVVPLEKKGKSPLFKRKNGGNFGERRLTGFDWNK